MVTTFLVDGSPPLGYSQRVAQKRTLARAVAAVAAVAAAAVASASSSASPRSLTAATAAGLEVERKNKCARKFSTARRSLPVGIHSLGQNGGLERGVGHE